MNVFHTRVFEHEGGYITELYINAPIEAADDFLVVRFGEDDLDELETAVKNAQRAIHE